MVAGSAEEDMSNLLHRLRIPGPARGQKTPVMLEFPVNPDTAPFLVSSSKSVVWIDQAMEPSPEMWPADGAPGDIVRVAVRVDENKLGDYFHEVVQAVAEKGLASEWGNIHDYSEDGVVAAIEHVEHYDLGTLCLLYNTGDLNLKVLALDHECLPQPSSWLPPGMAVVVPKEREFVGSIGTVGRGRKGVVVVVHNAARGMAIATASPGGA